MDHRTMIKRENFHTTVCGFKVPTVSWVLEIPQTCVIIDNDGIRIVENPIKIIMIHGLKDFDVDYLVKSIYMGNHHRIQ